MNTLPNQIDIVKLECDSLHRGYVSSTVSYGISSSNFVWIVIKSYLEFSKVPDEYKLD